VDCDTRIRPHAACQRIERSFRAFEMVPHNQRRRDDENQALGNPENGKDFKE
jgi:hypothetical protein